MALVVMVLSFSILGHEIGATGGRGLIRECVEPLAGRKEVKIIYVATMAVSLLATAPPTALLLTMAATQHLRLVALYMLTIWFIKPLLYLQASMECSKHASEAALAWVSSLSFVLDPIVAVLSIVVYLVLLKQRLEALEASSFSRLGVLTFRRVAGLLLLASAVLALVITVNVLLVSGGQKARLHSADYIMRLPIGILFWLVTVLFALLLWAAVRVMRAARVPLLAVGRAGHGRISSEAERASKALSTQAVGVVVGLATTWCEMLVHFAWIGTLWPVPISALAAVTVPLEATADIVNMFDDVGNTFAALALSGCFSGALRATSASEARRRRRRQRWALSAAEWRRCRRDLGEGWQNKVEAMAERGISLGALINFYRGLGSSYMPHYDPAVHTTADVVWQAIIPLSCASRSALSATLMAGRRSRPHKMVTHNWGNLFHDLVAAIIADALDEPEYAMVSYLLQRDVGRLEQWVNNMGKRTQIYWVCAFCVNQHLSICDAPPEHRPVDAVTGNVPPACPCGLSKATNETEPTLPDGRSIPCEMNKFAHMIQQLSATDPNFGQVIAVDVGFRVFSRAWCVSEIAAASAMGMEQHLKLGSADGLERHEKEMRSLRVQDMKASRPEDTRAILAGIPDVDEFNRHLQSLLFDDLIPAWNDLDSSEQMLRAGRLIRWQGVISERRSVGLLKAGSG